MLHRQGYHHRSPRMDITHNTISSQRRYTDRCRKIRECKLEHNLKTSSKRHASHVINPLFCTHIYQSVHLNARTFTEEEESGDVFFGSTCWSAYPNTMMSTFILLYIPGPHGNIVLFLTSQLIHIVCNELPHDLPTDES